MKKVLVIGDSCDDVFIYGSCSRLCPEAPVPIINPLKTVRNLGMAGNVFNNLNALNVSANIMTNTKKSTKTRFVDEISNQLLLRVDEINEINEIDFNYLKTFDFKQYDAIVISDYNKGYLDEQAIEFISNNHNLVFLDTKKKIDSWANKIKFIKINENEYYNNVDYLLKKYDGELIVTLGKNGAKHWMNTYPIEEIHDIRDLSGAGDTFLAAFVANYINNNDICAAIKFANKCASWVVTQKGVVCVDINKI